MSDYADLLTDLIAEGDSADALVSTLDDAGWDTPTPAPGWTIRHQISHLTWTDRKVLLAVTDPDEFRDELRLAIDHVAEYLDQGAREGAGQPPAELLAAWRESRRALGEAFRGLPEGIRLPWYGRPISRASMVLGRLMETWAHGEDVAEALGVTRGFTPRLYQVASFGHRTYRWAFVVNGLPEPETDLRAELSTPDGALWTFGPADATDRVTGPALDFCLRTTQRRHRDDLALVAEGSNADTWLDIAQAFAGPPGDGRAPGQHA
ncbi:MAG TPA: TIGR03084 family metal-binding protein [Mycobacteriales bacterium]|nr:TIGR03084 family metal-binding protein [Mycobacteriales bacterium]